MNVEAGNSNKTVTGQTINRSSQDAPKDYLIPAILVTIFCCLPIGIVAIVKSVDVRRRIQRGDTDGAIESSEAAKKWTLIALVTGIIFTVVWIIVRVAVTASAENT